MKSEHKWSWKKWKKAVGIGDGVLKLGGGILKAVREGLQLLVVLGSLSGDTPSAVIENMSSICARVGPTVADGVQESAGAPSDVPKMMCTAEAESD